jgi:hypothetical protein
MQYLFPGPIGTSLGPTGGTSLRLGQIKASLRLVDDGAALDQGLRCER